MPNRCFILNLIIVVFLLTTYSNMATCEDSLSLSKSVDLAKRSLYTKEHNFLKNRPMSKELQAFIDRYRNKRQNDKRAKRSQVFDEDQMYIVQNGQLTPLRDLKYHKREEENGRESFTVVPLVIPINGKNIKSRLLKARNLDISTTVVATTVGPVSEASVALTSSTGSVGNVSHSVENAADEDGGNSTQEETQVLHKILEDIEGLMQWKHSNGNKKEGVICSVNGSWISDAAGMRFDINFKNSTRKKFRIHVADRIPPNEEGFLCDGNWSVFGELPFAHSGVIIVLAVHSKDKHLAMFIGECRVCEGSETVSGTWLIGRSSRDCKDQKASHKVLSDIWKKEEAHLLRKKHLKQLGIATSDDD